MSDVRFKELDHRIGRHSSPDEGCPVCRPDLNPFTAASPSMARIAGADYSGLFFPGMPDYGSVWHEPGSGLWVFVKDQDKPSAEGRWINALADGWVFRDGDWLGSGLFKSDRARAMKIERVLDPMLVRSKAMGVDPLAEASDQVTAMLYLEINKKDAVPLENPITELIEGSLGTTVRVSVRVIPRPSAF